MTSPTRSGGKQGMQSNMDVDYVISFRFASTGGKTFTNYLEDGLTDSSDKALAAQQFGKLVEKLGSVGLATEVRQGDSHSLLVFTKVLSEDHMYGEVYRSRYGFLSRCAVQHLLTFV